jgi:ribonuclease E
VAEVTSLGLVQMTRKRVGEGLLEAFSETCPTCGGRGVLMHTEPVETRRSSDGEEKSSRRRGKRGKGGDHDATEPALNDEQRKAAASAMAAIAGKPPHDEDADESLIGSVNGAVPEAATEAATETATEAATEAAAHASGETEPQPSTDAPPAAESAPAPRRRRRAASRPAGPPAAAEPSEQPEPVEVGS